MKTVLKSVVKIKGTKDALIFILDDAAPWSVILEEIKYKLEQHKSSHIWDGPRINIKFSLGERVISAFEEEEIKELFASRKNMKIIGFEPYSLDNNQENITRKSIADTEINIMTGTVRSGQVIEYKGDLLLLGDINPGGVIRSTGSIYVVGAVRGVAHAGSEGAEDAIITASILRPTQIRINNIIAGALSQLSEPECTMCFAYLADTQIILDKLINLSKARPNLDRRLRL